MKCLKRKKKKKRLFNSKKICLSFPFACNLSNKFFFFKSLLAMCLLCTKEDLVICQNFISQFSLLKKKVLFFVKEKEYIINFVVRTHMKKTKQRKQKIIKGWGWGASFSQLFQWLKTAKLSQQIFLQVPPQMQGFLCVAFHRQQLAFRF